MLAEDFKTSLVGGGQPLRNAQLLCADGRHLVVPFNNQLRVYLLTTRQCVRSLKFTVQNGIFLEGLVSLRQDLENENLLWAFLASGEVLLINWREKVVEPLVKKMKLTLAKDDSLLSVVRFDGDSVLTLTGKKSSNPHTRSLVNYKLGNKIETSTLSSVKSTVLFAISKDSKTIAFLTKPGDNITQIVTLNVESGDKTTTPYPYKTHITAIALANDGTIALGSQSGVIQLVFPDTTIRALKWHIDAVKSLAFSNDGRYLLSGGLERVLVFWQLDTEKQQFLPRLAGEVSDIEVPTDELYMVTVRLDVNHEQYELLVLSSADLQSRLSVTGPRQAFTSPLSAMKKVHKLYEKDKSMDVQKLKYDFTTPVELHPTTKQMYLIHGAHLQVFDYHKSEQAFVQKITDTLQTGKVRSELKLMDPEVKKFAFTTDGKWLATVEEHHHGEIDNLLSQNDLTCVLKIWRFVESQKGQPQQSAQGVTSSWELITKIVNPHGVGVPVRSLIAAPSSYFHGLAFLSADVSGGVRLWRPQPSSPAWSLRKLKPSMGLHSNSVSLAWSPDSSLIFLGFDDTLIPIDTSSFEEITTPEITALTRVSGSTIRSLAIVDHTLVILASTCLKTINLLTLQENPLVVATHASKNSSNLLAINHTRGTLALAVNYYSRESKHCDSKIFVFSPHTLQPLYVSSHDTYISSLVWNGDEDFLFLDIKSRIGLVTSSKLSSEDEFEGSRDYEQEMAVLLAQAEASSKVAGKLNGHSIANAEEINSHKTLDANSFATLFDSIGTIKLETLFERVMQVVE